MPAGDEALRVGDRSSENLSYQVQVQAQIQVQILGWGRFSSSGRCVHDPLGRFDNQATKLRLLSGLGMLGESD